MKIVWVKCEITIPVSVPENDYDEFFDIEENHCPGTGIVGTMIDNLLAYSDKESTCWACTAKGENTIVCEPENADELLRFYKERNLLKEFDRVK